MDIEYIIEELMDITSTYEYISAVYEFLLTEQLEWDIEEIIKENNFETEQEVIEHIVSEWELTPQVIKDLRQEAEEVYQERKHPDAR